MVAELCQINANDYASNFWENLRESEIFEQDDEDLGSVDPVVEDTGTPPPWVVVSVKCHVVIIILYYHYHINVLLP